MKRNILALVTIWTFLLMGSMAYAASGEYSIDGVVKGAYSHLDIDSNGAINIITSTTPIPGNTNKIVVQVNTNDFGSTKLVGIYGVKIELTQDTIVLDSGNTNTSGGWTSKLLLDGTYDVTVTPTHASYANFTPAPGTVSFNGVSQIKTITFNGVPSNTYSIVGNVKTLLAADALNVVMELKYGSTVLDNTDKPGTNGDYAITDLPDGVKYTVTPIWLTKTFNPVFTNVTLGGQDSSPVNFTEVVPPTTGQWTAIINSGSTYKLNTALVGGIGGYGFYSGNTPGPASVRAGTKTYFLLDPSWLTSRWRVVGTRLTIMWIDFSLNKYFTINLYEIDSSDNGKLIGSTIMNQDLFTVNYKLNTRWLAEVDLTKSSSGLGLSIRWPN